MSTDIDNNQLMAFIERIETVEEREQDEKEDKKGIYQELKGSGYDVKAVKAIVKIRKSDRQKRREEQEVLDLYASAIGMEI